MAQKIIFFAYEDGHQDNKDAISRAALEYNKHQKTYKVRKWEDLCVSGNVIAIKIFDQIKQCDKFACDITYLNHNVLFELGYAIAQKKILKIFLNPSITDAEKNYSDIKILKTIGYAKFLNAKDISKEFQKSTVGEEALLIEKIIPGYEKIELEQDIFLINIKNKNQAAIDIEDFLSIIERKYITNNEDEIPYQPLAWYLNAILKSKIVLLHMVGNDKKDYKATNAEYSLYAGLAYGLGKEVLMIAPAPFRAPIDYSDILIEYSSSDDCINKTETWLENRLKKEQGFIPVQNKDESKNEEADIKELNLLKLGIGEGVAEKEPFGGSDTFVEIEAYNKAAQKQKALVIGRKGTGKTEMFLRLQENFKNDKNNYNIVIKPDSDELLSNVELSNLYNTNRSKKSFLTTVWQYVIFSKIFIQIFNYSKSLGLTEKECEDIDGYHKENKDLFSLNFYGMILYIAGKYADQNIMQDPSLLDKIKKRINPMTTIINNYFEKRKYQKITILADNLDTGWDARSNLDIQSLMLISLMDYLDILNSQYKNKVNIRSVIFLRKDIYQYILRSVREPDKMVMDIIEIQWDNFPILLKNVIDKRMLNVLGINKDVEEIWKDYFNLGGTNHPFEKIRSQIVNRPRDAIYFISKLFESAVNNNRLNVINDDFDYALDAYSKFLYSNLIAELKAEFPLVEDILKSLQQVYTGLLSQFVFIPIENFYKIVQTILSKDECGKFLNVLMENNYLVAIIKKNNHVITAYSELVLAEKEKRFRFFRKNKILLNMRLIPFTE
jgi:hypothetical protein